jgi:DnaK suppressor protein
MPQDLTPSRPHNEQRTAHPNRCAIYPKPCAATPPYRLQYFFLPKIKNMTSEQLSHYKKLLEDQLSEILTTAKSHQQTLDESHTTHDFVGPDRAAELETLEVDSAIVDSEANLLEKIEHALKRVADGSYGICEGCKDPIPSARLDAKPSVSLCLPCQERHELTGE